MTKRKYVKRDYLSMTPMMVYDIVRLGELKKFPNNFLDKDTIKEIVRYVFLRELKFSREDIIKKVDHEFLMKHYMGGFRKFFDMKDYKVIAYCFPEMDIKAWEFRKVEPQFWKNKDNQKEFLLWVIEKENLNLDSKEDLRKITARMVINYGGSRILKEEPEFYNVLSNVVENRFKEWEIMKVRSWKKKKVKDAVRWLVEEKMGYTLEEACTLRIKDFKENNLDGMLQKVFNHSIIDALNFAYGNCFVRDGSKSIRLVTKNS